jgi:hypothetical protein
VIFAVDSDRNGSQSIFDFVKFKVGSSAVVGDRDIFNNDLSQERLNWVLSGHGDQFGSIAERGLGLSRCHAPFGFIPAGDIFGFEGKDDDRGQDERRAEENSHGRR